MEQQNADTVQDKTIKRIKIKPSTYLSDDEEIEDV